MRSKRMDELRILLDPPWLIRLLALSEAGQIQIDHAIMALQFILDQAHHPHILSPAMQQDHAISLSRTLQMTADLTKCFHLTPPRESLCQMVSEDDDERDFVTRQTRPYAVSECPKSGIRLIRKYATIINCGFYL